jgi:hypothetical protein
MTNKIVYGVIDDSFTIGKISDSFKSGFIDEVFKFVTASEAVITGIITEDGFNIITEDGQVIIPE